MVSQTFTESVVEEAALAWLQSLGYAILHGPDTAAGLPAAERTDPNYRGVILEGRFRQALTRLIPACPLKPWKMPTGSSPAPMRRRSWSATARCTGCWSMGSR